MQRCLLRRQRLREGVCQYQKRGKRTGGRALELCIIGYLAEYLFLLQRVLRRQQGLHAVPGVGEAGSRGGEHVVVDEGNGWRRGGRNKMMTGCLF